MGRAIPCDAIATETGLRGLPITVAKREHGLVAHYARALRAGSLFATLSVEGRMCSVRPLNASGVGSADGLAVLAETERALRDAVTWMPGRVLVMAGEALTPRAIDSLLTNTSIEAFAGIVVLADRDADLGHLADAVSSIPIVCAEQAVDQDRLRRAVRISVSVDTRPSVDARPVVAPAPRVQRVDRRRRAWIPAPRGIPGTIDLRPQRSQDA